MSPQNFTHLLAQTVTELSESSSLKGLFHEHKDGDPLPSGKVLREVIELCRAILFPGFYGKSTVNSHTLAYHIGVNVERLHGLLAEQIHAGLCFAAGITGINTLMGMAIDIEKRRPILSIATGGLSGPAVKPVALRMVWQVAKAVQVPVIGLGGIMNADDAIEFLLAGASAIQIGTANFIDPTVTVKVAQGINDYLERHGCKSVSEIIGALED